MKKISLLIMAIFIMVGLSAAPAEAGYFKQKWIRFSAVAGETLSVGDVVYIKTTDGKAYKADADDPNKRPAVGVVSKGAPSGSKVEITVAGILAGQTAVSPGSRLWLSTTAGGITSSIPTNEQGLGWALPGSSAASTANYFILIQTPVSDGAEY